MPRASSSPAERYSLRPADEFLTVNEVARTLKLNPQTVRNWIDRGGYPPCVLARGACASSARTSSGWSTTATPAAPSHPRRASGMATSQMLGASHRSLTPSAGPLPYNTVT
jgi:hypothetical protein